MRGNTVLPLLSGLLLATLGSRATAETLACRPLPEAIESLRARGSQIEVEAGLISPTMLVRGEPRAGEPAELLARLVEPYGLVVEQRSGRLAVRPGPELEPDDLARLRRLAGPVLQRESSVGVLPEVFAAGLGGAVLELEFPGSGEWPAELDPNLRYVVVRIADSAAADPGTLYRLKQRIVDTAARVSRARFALEGSSATLARLVDEELAPYVDAYLTTDGGALPAADPTGRRWWRTRLGSESLLEVLLRGADRGAAVVLLEDGAPSADQLRLVDRIRTLGVGVLEHQPEVESGPELTSTFFLDPKIGRYYLAVEAPSLRAERLGFELEPLGAIEVLVPAGAQPVTEVYGGRVEIQLDGSGRRWLFELTPGAPSAGVGQVLVEGDVLVDPYEVVVQNQVFQRREAEKVLSLDVMEYATIVPHWREGVRSTWEHRILERRGWLDEYLHLNLWRDGVRVPRNKLYKGLLNRPIDRIELEPLTVEHRKTYRYTYLGQDEIDGKATWKIGFEPLAPGRLVSGTVWIDQLTGAHRRIRTRHQALGVGVLGGEFTTDFGWIADGDQCFWDWRQRRGTEIVDSLDSSGSYSIDYQRRDFQFNRPDIEEVVERVHASDVLIHVATPPDGHRWLLRGEQQVPRRGDQPYRSVGTLREEDLRDLPDREPQAEELAECEAGTCGTVEANSAGSAPSEPASAGPSPGAPAARDEVLAGLYAFPSRSRISVGFSGGSGAVETRELLGFNYVDLDFLHRGRRGKGELYLWIGGFDDDGLISLTDPRLGRSSWSLTTSFDVRFDPEEDFLFRHVTGGVAGDESTFRDLSLDTERTSIRFALSRVVGGRWTTRLRYGYHLLRFDRRPGTDPAFVLPLDTPEHQLGFDLTYTGRRLEATWSTSVGNRESWRAWGIGAAQPSEPIHTSTSLRLTTSAPISVSQSWSASLGLFGGADQDRFSRTRLFQVDARVPGYSSSLGFDRGAHLALSYDFRLWRLPLRLRLDGARLHTDATQAEGEREQDLAGVQLNLDLHGPFETDLLFGVGRGLHAEPDLGVEETYYWMLVSRRFGGG